MAAGLDPPVQPLGDLGLQPADGALTQGDGLGETSLGNAQIDAAAGQAGAFANQREPQNSRVSHVLSDSISFMESEAKRPSWASTVRKLRGVNPANPMESSG